MELNEAQLHTLRHMLGINTPYDKIPRPYRNYAAVEPSDPEFIELAKLGAVEVYRRSEVYLYYRCTDQGRAAALRSHRKIRRTKAQRVYGKFLDLCDVFPDMTFKDFLTSPYFDRARKEA
ncbi:MAG: hypothetical protein WC314_25640 [Vulcanimicrobiota bacterium]